jgi:hypothetical protein
MGDLLKVIVLLTALGGTGFGAVNYFAKAADLAELGRDFRVDQIERRIDVHQERLWKIEDRMFEGCTVREKEILMEQRREIEAEMQKLKDRKKQIMKEGGG